MSDLNSSDLRDPQPPVPGERERALVASRAGQLGRRRHLLQGGGALAVVAAVAVSVAALAGGGASGPNNRVEAASSGSETTISAPSTTAAPVTTTVAPAPAPTVETVAPPAGVEEAPAAAAEAPAPAPTIASTFTLSGTVTGNPADSTVSVTITGPSGSFAGDSSFSVSGLTAGDYTVLAQWVDSTGTAQAITKKVVNVSGDTSVSLSF